MRWAVLGADDEADLVLPMLAALPGLELIRVPASEWESLLVRDDYDAVVVLLGAEESLRSEQLKKLVGAGISVAALHPPIDVLTAYEIEVIRRESAGVIVAFAPGWQHPAWDILCDPVALGDDSPLGRAEHVTFTRQLADRRRKSVLIQLSQDIYILRRLLGNITSVNAVGDSREDGSWNSLTVHFASDTGRSANWSMAAPNSATKATSVSVSGKQATTTLTISGDPGHQTWELCDTIGARKVFPPERDAQILAEKLGQATQLRPSSPTWSETCLDLEITEVVEKSLRRKRAIDLYTTNRSEEKTFKGFMAAAGCLVLLAVLLAFFGLALWDGFRAPFRDMPRSGLQQTEGQNKNDEQQQDGDQKKNDNQQEKDQQRWPLWARMWPVYPLLVFLLLQLLVLVARRSATESATNAGKPPEQSN